MMFSFSGVLKAAFLGLVVSSAAYVSIPKLSMPIQVKLILNGRKYRLSPQRKKKRNQEMALWEEECKKEEVLKAHKTQGETIEEKLNCGKTLRQRYQGKMGINFILHLFTSSTPGDHNILKWQLMRLVRW